MSQKFAGVKGMNDLLPPHIETWQFVEAQARQAFAAYGYSEIRTPIVEDTALFVRSVGEVTDIVTKEMYTFEDKGGRSITMRPENTAPAVRAYIEHGFAQVEPLTRWFYLGPMFRYERMKTGRYRQFYQIGCEAFGAADPAQDVEVISVGQQFLKRLGVTDVVLHLNSLGDHTTRPAYTAALTRYFEPFAAVMSEDAKITLAKNPMRLLDSKEEALQEPISRAPAILDFIDDASKAHFDEVRRLLDGLGLAHAIDRRLVRGLDYYTRTTFEFIYQPQGENALGTAGTVCGGGRYDRLVKELGGPDKPAVGFAMGLDRLVLLLEALGKREASRPMLFVVTMDGPVRDHAIKLVMALRNQGLAVDFDPRGGKVKRQVERASHVRARYLFVYGDAEHQGGQVRLKDMDLPEDHPKKEQQVALAELARWLTTPGTHP